MGLNCGIVGLPNVGKSTLFNALTATIAAQAANYPFCTIEPNMGVVAVPDARLEVLAKVANSAQIIPAQIEFWDIAGLVKGASLGEGLGNQFLGNIRSCDAIIHVVRCFENSDIVHVENSIDPLRDIEIIETELMLSDLESLNRRLPSLQKKGKTGDKEAQLQASIIEKIVALLEKGEPAKKYVPTDVDEEKIVRELGLLSSKPTLYVCNVDESSAATGNEFSKKVAAKAQSENNSFVIISASIEQEISQLSSPAEKIEFLETLGLSETGLSKVIRASYNLLGLSTYFTVGPKETHAWTIKKNSLAPVAAGVIHSDFEKGFIRAETISYDDFVTYSGEAGARAAGKLRTEGKSYAVQDGDVMHFLFNN
jgi:GTP-binding protein YchF